MKSAALLLLLIYGTVGNTSAVLKKATLSCKSTSSSGSYANCPSDYSAVSCSCGNGCGSWDIQSEKTCYCQCANQDWTRARCCKMRIK